MNEVPLKSSNFSIENLENEWKLFKRMCIRNYSNIKSPIVFWQRILSYRKDEYSNVCALAEICLVEEKKEILKSATKSYLQKRRRTPKYAKKVSFNRGGLGRR